MLNVFQDIYNHFYRIRSNDYIPMRILQSSRTCPICGIELRERDVVKHSRRCSKVKRVSKVDGSWECMYSGSHLSINNMDGTNRSASGETLEYRT
jgi:hypothetical protein